MTKYLITLEPLEPFFFGGEHTFGKDASRQEDKARYYAKSEYFPQQSAVLGMLRKAILNKKKLMTLHRNGEWVDVRDKITVDNKKMTKKQLATKLVGNGSFSYEQSFDMGSLASISALFVMKDKKSYVVAEADRIFTPSYSSDTMYIQGKAQKIICFEGYDAKEYIPIKLLSKEDEITLDEVFKSQLTVGIKKAINGKTEDDAFFLKQSYSFDKACFALYLESSTDMTFLDSTIVSLGADMSSFMLRIKSTEDTLKNVTQGIFSNKQGFTRMVLLSETLLSPKAYGYCEFILGSRNTQRHLVKNDNNKNKKYKKSKRYTLLERGTVIYTQEIDNLQTELNQPHLQKVGINQYICLKGEQQNA